jgi:hypothetical protein
MNGSNEQETLLDDNYYPKSRLIFGGLKTPEAR